MKRIFLFTFLITMQCFAHAQLPQYIIGQTAFKGIVFYVENLGNGRQRGLVCSPFDLSSGARWYAGQYLTTGADFSGIYAGKNTNIIIGKQGLKDTSYAAALCARYDSAGTWYLPSVSELYLMYVNLYKQSKTLRDGAHFGNNPGGYWSSTEWAQDSTTTVPSIQSEQSAWIVDFYGPVASDSTKKLTLTRGGPGLNNKFNRNRVRAVKEFRNFAQ